MSKHPIENIAESHRTEAINWPLLLLTHAACVDEQLHVRETDSLRRFAEEWGASQVTKDAMTAIIEQDEEAPSAGKIASKIDIESREPTLRYLLYLSHVDGHHHPHERKLAKDVAREWRIGNETLRQMTDQAAELAKQTDFDEVGEDEDVELNFRERLLKTTEDHVPSGVIDTIVRIGPSRLSRKVDRARQRILLSGEDYEEALDECAEVARQDFDSAAETTREALDDFREVETDLAEQLERLEEKTSSESSATDEVKGQFAATAESLEEEVHSRMERLQSAFEARERAVGYFTIALMGRTKVGKSTLHATLTGQGWDSIGDGQQRKTRLNRVYEWRNIRIIDTPGIGAPGGKSDEEIAASVIDEADVVCYVLTNDSQQKSEFEFLKKLQGRAKPVVLLLNVKKNLKDERRLKRFLKNPDRLFQTDGHEERIRRYASEHLENDMFEIIPVQLLAAQLARQEDYNDITEKLMEASRFNDFLDFLRVSLIENGSIRRSQTFLGSTARDLAEMSKWLSSEQSKFEHLEATLDTKRGELLEELDEAKESAHRQIEGGIKDIFQDLHDTIPSFANENYDCSDEEVLQQRWQDHMTNTRIEERVNTRFEEVIVDYRDRVESAVEEIDQDIEKALAIEFDDANLSTKDVGVGIKRFLKIGDLPPSRRNRSCCFRSGGRVVLGQKD